MSRPLRADAERNRLRVLQAARAVFAERGLGATLDQVADEAGVGVATVYRRFGSKEELVEALFADELDALARHAVDAQQVADAWDGLTQMLHGMCAVLVEDQGMREVLLHAGFGQERVAAARRRFLPAAEVVVARAHRAGQLRPEFTAAELPVLLLMVEAAGTATRGEDPALWRRYLALALEGLRADSGGSLPLEPLSVDRLGRAIDASRR